jgi:metalloendopeptidase OMA1, mitochondrial
MIGLHYMARGGYDPRESIAFWRRMEQTGRDQPPEFLSTHPSHGHRIEQLEAEMPKALQEYEQSTQKQSGGS